VINRIDILLGHVRVLSKVNDFIVMSGYGLGRMVIHGV